jgi:hypothetical protein
VTARAPYDQAIQQGVLDGLMDARKRQPSSTVYIHTYTFGGGVERPVHRRD